jgi:biopolymer transport protein ExbB
MIATLYHILLSYFNKGGPLMWFIFGVSIVAWTLGVEKLFYLGKFRRWRRRFLRQAVRVIETGHARGEVGYRPYDELLAELGKCCRAETGRCSCTQVLREFLISTVPEVEKGFSTMSAWISVAPLLGLLGTVSGMIQTFRVITDFGLGNPNLTAQGISVALVTTQAGLTVAFPMMIFHNYLVNRSRGIVSKLIIDGESLVKRIEANRPKHPDKAA